MGPQGVLPSLMVSCRDAQLHSTGMHAPHMRRSAQRALALHSRAQQPHLMLALSSHCRRDLELARTLADQVRRREKLKRRELVLYKEEWAARWQGEHSPVQPQQCRNQQQCRSRGTRPVRRPFEAAQVRRR